MLNIDEIEKTILDLERHDTTYATCEKLAWLYIVRDHLVNASPESRSISNHSGSEFLEACSGCGVECVLRVLDEHMQAVKTLYPREYSALIEKIKEAQS